MKAAVLFARSDSIYKILDGIDVFDIERDARTFTGRIPVITHPPCRAWGRLRAFAKPRPDEKALAFFAIEQVRKNGGVLEHPAWSSLWPAAGLPQPGEYDDFGGFTLPIVQFWFGHKAMKATWLYIVGVTQAQLPVIPLRLGESSHVIACYSDIKHAPKRPQVSIAEREETPIALAQWLVEVAEIIALNRAKSC